MTNEREALERLAREVMGWDIRKGREGTDQEACFADVPYGTVTLYGPGVPTRWNPFTDANADVQVLKRVREIWKTSYTGVHTEPWALFWDHLADYSVDYEVGDYARAALAVLEGTPRKEG